MDRKKFIKSSIAGAALASTPSILKAKNVKLKESTYDKLMDQVGFNHIPNKEMNTPNSVLHRASTRGGANHGWLNTKHSFSFANYYNPERMHFGVLRVLNDDVIDGGTGFNTHPHDNMEIISIPLEGALEHKDSMGNIAVIQKDDIQVMSAGTGVYHSEYNKYKDQQTKFLQIWLFPNKKNVEPRYDQISLKDVKVDNGIYQILSPNQDDAGVWIHQNAWFHLGEFTQAQSTKYSLKNPTQNGAYIFVLEGDIIANDQDLHVRDGYGIWDTKEINISTQEGSRFLIMEVPMTV